MVSLAATATAQAPPQQRQPQQQKPTDAALIAAIIAAFLSWHTAAQILAALRAPFRLAGISGPAAKAAIGLVLSMPQQPLEGTGPATRWSVRTNAMRRAAFTLATTRRLQAALDAASAHGESPVDAMAEALLAERRWFAAHVHASDARVAAASRVDGMASIHGDLLGWQAVTDKRCTPGCRRASGRNFRASQPPVVEGHPALPGAVHGASCRCVATRPFRGAPVMPGLGTRGAG